LRPPVLLEVFVGFPYSSVATLQKKYVVFSYVEKRKRKFKMETAVK
jgi:hypothetical protein